MIIGMGFNNYTPSMELLIYCHYHPSIIIFKTCEMITHSKMTIVATIAYILLWVLFIQLLNFECSSKQLSLLAAHFLCCVIAIAIGIMAVFHRQLSVFQKRKLFWRHKKS